MRSPRLPYLLAGLLLFVLELAIARFLHDPIIRPYGGDALAVVGVYCLVRFVALPRWRLALAGSLLFAFAIEALQGIDAGARLGLDPRSAAGIALGSTFDPFDLVAYAVGALLVVLVERSRPMARGIASR